MNQNGFAWYFPFPVQHSVMLLNPQEASVMSNARQPALRDPQLTAAPSINAFSDFFKGLDISGASVLEAGPGQCDFAALLKQSKAAVWIIDNDPAVLSLALMRGYTVLGDDLRSPSLSLLRGKFRLVFCRAAFNAFWHSSYEECKFFVDRLVSLVAEDGYGWFSPWNDVRDGQPGAERVEQTLEWQRRSFEQNGYVAVEVDNSVAHRYGISRKKNSILYLKNLSMWAGNVRAQES